MINPRKYRFLPGFTLVETVTVVIISGIVMLGMFKVSSDISGYFGKESYYEDINHYGNTALDKIVIQLKKAEEIQLSAANGYRMIRLRDGNNNQDHFHASRYDGILQNGVPLMKYRSFKEGSVNYELSYFWCDPIPQTIQDPHKPSYSKLRESIFLIELHIDAVIVKDGQRIVKPFMFNREVFAPRHYL